MGQECNQSYYEKVERRIRNIYKRVSSNLKRGI